MILAREEAAPATNERQPLHVGSTAHQFCVSSVKDVSPKPNEIRIPRSVLEALDPWRRAELEVLAEDGLVVIEGGGTD